MRSIRILFALLTLALTVPASAQHDIRDTSLALIPLTIGYSYQVPGADMGLRFGANHSVSFATGYKFRSNYQLGVQASFLFGNRVQESGLLDNMIDSQGQILNKEGKPAGVLIQERGYSILGYASRILNIAGPNLNSGLMLRLGGGMLRHKIRLETQNDEVPQLEGDNLEGYDRLAAGPAAYLFVGYQHFSNNRRINFMFGYEIVHAFTEPLRAFNFDTGKAETDTRHDALNGIRFGWIFPIFIDKPEKVFYY